VAESDELAPGTADWLAPPTPARPPGTPTATAPNVAPVGQEHPAPVGEAPALPLSPAYPARLYWHLADARGVLHRYEVRATTQRLVVQVPRRLARAGNVLRVYYQGYTGQYGE